MAGNRFWMPDPPNPAVYLHLEALSSRRRLIVWPGMTPCARKRVREIMDINCGPSFLRRYVEQKAVYPQNLTPNMSEGALGKPDTPSLFSSPDTADLLLKFVQILTRFCRKHSRLSFSQSSKVLSNDDGIHGFAISRKYKAALHWGSKVGHALFPSVHTIASTNSRHPLDRTNDRGFFQKEYQHR